MHREAHREKRGSSAVWLESLDASNAWRCITEETPEWTRAAGGVERWQSVLVDAARFYFQAPPHVFSRTLTEARVILALTRLLLDSCVRKVAQPYPRLRRGRALSPRPASLRCYSSWASVRRRYIKLTPALVCDASGRPIRPRLRIPAHHFSQTLGRALTPSSTSANAGSRRRDQAAMNDKDVVRKEGRAARLRYACECDGRVKLVGGSPC